MQGGPGYPSFATFNQSFGYDQVNRLTSASESGGWSRTYSYDQWGNLWVPSESGQPWSGSTPTTNVYNSGTNRDGRWSYDGAGNLLSVNGNTATYDAENRERSLSNTNNGLETLSYDALGERLQKSNSAGTTVYVYDALGQLAAEYVGGSWSRDYIFDGAGNLIATENAAGLCTTCYFAYDHLGSMRLVMDQNGNVVGRHDYLPFGEEINTRTTPGFNTSDTVTQKFTGQIRDQEAGVDYFNLWKELCPRPRRRWLARRNLERYERHAAWVLPAQDIRCHLRVRK